MHAPINWKSGWHELVEFLVLSANEIEDEGEKNELISPDVYIWIRQTMLEDFLTFDSSMFAQSISEEMQANMRCSCNSAWDHTWSSLLFLMSLTLVELEEDVRCQYQWEIKPQS